MQNFTDSKLNIYRVSEENLNKNPNVFSLNVNNKRVFVKKKISSKQNFFHKLQYLIYKFVKHPILIPTVLNASENNVVFETDKINKLQKLNLNVPEILYSSNEYFVMSDTGESLIDYIPKNYAEKNELIDKVIENLVFLHNTGNAHGGCKINNFTIKDDKIYLIDFEEKIPDMHISYFKQRDLIILMLTLEKEKFDPDVKRITDLYSKLTKTNYNEKLKKKFVFFKVFLFLQNPIFKKIIGKDVKAFLKLVVKFCK